MVEGWWACIHKLCVCVWDLWDSKRRVKSTILQLSYLAVSINPGNESNETEFIFLYNVYIETHQLWSASLSLFVPTAACSSTVQRCYELWSSSQSWFLHLGLVKLNGVEHMQTNAFVLWDKAACLLQTALIHSLLLFPLHRFLSLFMSKFN